MRFGRRRQNDAGVVDDKGARAARTYVDAEDGNDRLPLKDNATVYDR